MEMVFRQTLKFWDHSIVKLVETNSPQCYFQQDNAPCHKSRELMRWFEEKDVMLSLPPQSADFSFIEILLHILKSIANINVAQNNMHKQKFVE